jgi:NAD(P)-dependent dehydrogenase (short-subunit alcohol dehydrogenase family)
MFRLDDKVAVVTGASQGIGAAIARGLAEAGADLLLVARRADVLEGVADHLRADTGRRVETLVADVTSPDTPGRIAARVHDTWSGLDVLVNNAYSSGGVLAPVLELDDEVWDDVLTANVLAPFRLCRELVPLMAGREGASVVNVVSGSGFLPSPGIGAYGVSKAALWMLTRQLAVELAPDVRVNALCPGIVSPDGQPAHQAHLDLLPLVPMRRLGRPEEMAGAVVYLASPAASYTTGEVVFANGGRPW